LSIVKSDPVIEPDNESVSQLTKTLLLIDVHYSGNRLRRANTYIYGSPAAEKPYYREMHHTQQIHYMHDYLISFIKII
jgi:hypothetical protein